MIDKESGLYKLELILIGLPQRINEAPGASWHTRYKESQRWHKRVLGRMLIGRLSPPLLPLEKAHLTLIRHSRRAPDYDGLVHSFKPVIDALKKCLIIKDDNMRIIGRPDYRWEKAAPKDGKIEVIVREVKA
jgi:hypothetical protein